MNKYIVAGVTMFISLATTLISFNLAFLYNAKWYIITIISVIVLAISLTVFYDDNIDK